MRLIAIYVSLSYYFVPVLLLINGIFVTDARLKERTFMVVITLVADGGRSVRDSRGGKDSTIDR